MALNYDELMATSVVDLPHSYSDTDSMLYAISIGLGRNAASPDELPYVYEQGEPMRTVPTMASVLVPDMSPPDLGWDFSQVLHIEQRLELYRPLPIAADLLINKRIAAAYDHGPKRGALVLYEAEARLAKDDTALFKIGNTIMARADGGFGGPRGTGPAPHRPPRREPDLSCDLDTRSDQALLYRLNGDRNPLHADPALARRVGYPVLHADHGIRRAILCAGSARRYDHDGHVAGRKHRVVPVQRQGTRYRCAQERQMYVDRMRGAGAGSGGQG